MLLHETPSWLRNPWLWLIASGALLAASQLAAPFAWCVFPGFALFVLGTRNLQSWKQAILGGLVVGTLKTLGGNAWIWYAYPLVTFDPDSAFVQLTLIGLYWLSGATFMSVCFILSALAVYRLRERTILLMLVVPFAWLFGEVAGSLLSSLWVLGPGSYLNIYYAYGYMGIPLAQFSFFYPVMKMAGLYGLTYIAAFSGTLLALLVIRARDAVAGAALFMVVLLLAYLTVSPHGQVSLDVRVVAVDTSFTSASQKTSEGYALKRHEIERAIEVALTTGIEAPDIILLPEDSRFTTHFDDTDVALAYLEGIAPEAGTIVVDSARTDIGDGKVTLRAYYYDLGVGAVYMTDKQYFVPQGEFISYMFRWPLQLLGKDEIITTIDQNQNYIPGPMKGYEGFPEDIPTTMFCFESSSALGLRSVEMYRDTPLVLHPLSHGWFNEPHILWYQLSAMLRAQAVWGNATIVSAANMGESQIFYPDGRIGGGEVIASVPYWRLVEYEL